MKAIPTCSVDGCDRPSKARGWCFTHYMRWRTTGELGTAELLHQQDRGCSVPDCERRHKGLGYCKLHWERFKRHGDPHRVDRPRAFLGVTGAANPNWKGDRIGYGAAHLRVKAQRGSASDYSCQHCGAPAEDWAYDHADANELREVAKGRELPYSADPGHYLPLCKPCHWRFDRI